MYKTVYLAGPMVGLSLQEMNGWRQELTNMLSVKGVDVLDPTRRVPFGGRGYTSPAYAQYIFKSDLRDIQLADAVFFDVRESSGKGAGTQMEIMYSWMLKKPMYLWRNPQDFRHPFYSSMEASTGSSMHTLAEFLISDLEMMDRQEALIQ